MAIDPGNHEQHQQPRQSSPAERLRNLLRQNGILIAPGVFDGLSAKLAEQAGFAALYCTGGGISRSRGMPDLGYTTLSELVERIGVMTEICSLPMIVDIDSGFGGPLCLRRAIRLLERAGAAAIHVQDIEVPHRHRASVENIVPVGEMQARLQVALSARTDIATLIIARTDVLPILGMEEAIQRVQAYGDAGVDMVYVEFMRTRQEMETVARRVPIAKLVSLCHGEDEPMPPADLAEMGYKVVTLPADAQLAAIHAMRALFAHVKQHGSPVGFRALATFAERDEIVGARDDRKFELGWLN